MQNREKNILVTCALPYANGPLHIGHLLEYIEADIWVRYQKMQHHNVYFICGNDAHGTPIMLKAETLGISPTQLIEQIHQAHTADFKDFLIAFDDFYTTHSDENQQLCEEIYQTLKQNGYIKQRIISQLFDPVKGMFLPDRYVKGACPRCYATEQYGDNCEVCGATYAPTDLSDPRSILSNAVPVLRDSCHLFFDLPAFSDILQQILPTYVTQQQVANKLQEWFTTGLAEWNITRDAPYFGFQVPGMTDKYFYVWLDAPIGYMSAFKHFCKKHPELDFDDFWRVESPHELYHFIGKDIVYFHALFWPAMLSGSRLRIPTGIFVHGYVTINGEKMSKSRGTFITARDYLDHLDADYLRYYYATKLSGAIVDVDLNLDDFIQRVNTDLVNKVVNLASRCTGFIHKRFAGKLAAELDDQAVYAHFLAAGERIQTAYQKRDFSRAMRDIMLLADEANRYIDQEAPWVIAKNPELAKQLQQVCSLGINLFRLLMTYLKPVVPQLAQRVEAFLQHDLCWQNIAEPLCDHTLAPFKPLLQRITTEQVAAILNTKNGGKM